MLPAWLLLPCAIVISVCSVHSLQPTSVEISGSTGITFRYVLVGMNTTIRLTCDGQGGNVSWTNPLLLKLVYDETAMRSRVRLDFNGTLMILETQSEDGGYYWCTRDDNIANASIWHIMIDPWFRHHLEMESVTYGWYAALGMLVLGVTVGIMKIIVRLCCPACHARASAAARVQQMRQLIVSLETYRNDQSTRLRDNYNAQVVKLKESCATQMETLRDHYGTKIARFRNYRLPLGNFGEQYWQQAGKIRDYSSVQMDRLQDNYARNLGKLRTYSVIQLERFRQQYKLQHKHMVKIMEAMNFNIELCRNGEIPPGQSLDLNTDMNVDFSLVNLPLESSDVRDGSSGSMTNEEIPIGFTLRAECFEQHACPDFDTSSLNYVTPPTGGSPVCEGDAPPLDPCDPILLKAFADALLHNEKAENGSGDIEMP